MMFIDGKFYITHDIGPNLLIKPLLILAIFKILKEDILNLVPFLYGIISVISANHCNFLTAWDISAGGN